MGLSDAKVRIAKPETGKTASKFTDGDGMYLLVNATGKYWRMDYRFAGKRRTLALGVYPDVGLADARRKRQSARQYLADGIDPGEAKRAEKAGRHIRAGNTLEVIAREWLAARKPGWSGTHFVRETRNVEKDLLPRLGHRPIADIKPLELLEVARRAQERGALDVGYRILQTSKGIWGYALLTGRTEVDITHGLNKGLQPRTKENFPAITEPQEFGAFLRACRDYKGGPVVRAALAIAPLLFQRPANLRQMRWADIDLDQAVWTIPAADMKGTVQAKATGSPHVVPLPTQVVAVLRDLKPLTGQHTWVFPGFRDAARPMSDAALAAALSALGYRGIQSWHGLRASGRTLIREQLKFDPDVIESQLAHTTHIRHGGAYDRARFVAERADMLQQWADYLDNLRDSPRGANPQTRHSAAATQNAQRRVAPTKTAHGEPPTAAGRRQKPSGGTR